MHASAPGRSAGTPARSAKTIALSSGPSGSRCGAPITSICKAERASTAAAPARRRSAPGPAARSQECLEIALEPENEGSTTASATMKPSNAPSTRPPTAAPTSSAPTALPTATGLHSDDLNVGMSNDPAVLEGEGGL